MAYKSNRAVLLITTGLLLLIGFYMIMDDRAGLGTGLVAGAIGVFTVKFLKQRRIAQLEAQGKVAYDERSLYLASKAALAAIRVYLALLAVIVLAGSCLGPDEIINPWDLTGVLLAVLVVLWTGFYYYFCKTE